MEGSVTLRTLIFRSLRFHARSHLGVLTGAAIASAVLTGALLVGNSMRQSLRQRALGRLGPVHFALAPQDRFFSSGLVMNFVDFADNAWRRYPRAVCPGLHLPGTMSRDDGSARANKVNVFGFDRTSWHEPFPIPEIPQGSVIVLSLIHI